MYEPKIDYKLSIEDFLYVMDNLSTNVVREVIDNFSCLSIEYIVNHLKSGNKEIPDLQNNDVLEEGFTSGDVLHVFKDKSGISVFTDEKYIHVFYKAKDVEDYMLIGVCFSENEPYVFMPRELLVISKELNSKIEEYERLIVKYLRLSARFSKSNQGKRKIREAESAMRNLEKEIDLIIEKGFYRV